MVKTAAAAFAFLALFGTPIAAQFADAEEAKSWFFLQRIARDLEDLFHCASIVAAADSDRGLAPAAPILRQLRTRPTRRVTSRWFAPIEPAYHSRACCLGSADLRPVFLRPVQPTPQICPAFCSTCWNSFSASACSLSSAFFCCCPREFCCAFCVPAALAP